MNYRGYFWGNWYLRSIQQGIQAAHCLGEMVLEFKGPFVKNAAAYTVLDEWLNNHKTMILLNGGYSDNIEAIYSQFDESKLNLPYAIFREEKAALNGAACSVGIIVPDYIWKHDVANPSAFLTSDELALFELINKSQLAT